MEKEIGDKIDELITELDNELDCDLSSLRVNPETRKVDEITALDRPSDEDVEFINDQFEEGYIIY